MGGDDALGDDIDQVARFEAVFESNYQTVVSYAMRRTSEAADAYDVASDVFLAVWRRIDAVPTGEGQRSWVIAVAHNCLRNHWRASGRARRLTERVASVDPPRSAPCALDRAEESIDIVAGVLDTLPELDREIVLLAEWERLSHAEIGSIVGVSANAIGIRLHRIRKRLRAEVERRGQAEPVTGLGGQT